MNLNTLLTIPKDLKQLSIRASTGSCSIPNPQLKKNKLTYDYL